MQRFGDILELASTSAESAPALAPALAWTLAAGATLAPLARYRDLHGGVLTLEIVRAGDTGARRRIESVAPELRRALNRMLGPDQVRRLRILG